MTSEPGLTENSLLARSAKYDPAEWTDTYLRMVQFEPIYRGLTRFACSQLETVLGRYGTGAACAVLRALPLQQAQMPAEVEANLAARDWRAVMEYDRTEEEIFDWQEIGADLAHAYAYVRNGEAPGRNPDEARQQLDALLRRLRALSASFSPGLRQEVGPPLADVAELHDAGEARWAMDNGKPVDPAHLAALAVVKPKTLANLIASRQLATDADGKVPAAVALEYCKRRKEFVPSWWQTWQDPAFDATAAPAASPVLDEQVFVPVDADGLPFLPDLARPSRDGTPQYAIGEKANPEYVVDYWEALSRLARMPVPRWRRPNAQRNWGLVSAQDSWRRYSKADLERMVLAARGGS